MQTPLSGMKIMKEMDEVELFYKNFNHLYEHIEGFIKDESVSKLRDSEQKYDEIIKLLERFSILEQIDNPNFIYENYKKNIEVCSTPKVEYLRQDLMKLKLKIYEEKKELALNTNL